MFKNLLRMNLALFYHAKMFLVAMNIGGCRTTYSMAFLTELLLAEQKPGKRAVRYCVHNGCM
jgi:hypothetical protein